MKIVINRVFMKFHILVEILFTLAKLAEMLKQELKDTTGAGKNKKTDS